MYGINTQMELQHFKNNLMDKVKVSNEDYYQIIRNKQHSSKFSHIQYNHLSGQNYIGLDCDIDVFNVIEEKNINPNLVVKNKNNNRAHLFFRLSSFVGTTPNARTKPQKALRLLTHSLNNHLGTDKHFNGVQAKNPLNDSYDIFSFSNESYDFDELFENIPDEQIYVNKPEISISEDKEIIHVGTGERNIYLFDTVRFQSYKIKHKHNNFNSFYDEIERIYNDLNAMLAEPMDFKECQHSIKSIATWTWCNFVGDGKNRGVMDLASKGHDLSDHDKKVIGASYSAKIKRETTQNALQDAFNELVSQCIKPTQKAVANLSGKSLITVKRNWSKIEK